MAKIKTEKDNIIGGKGQQDIDYYVVKTSDNGIFRVVPQIAKLSEFMKEMVDDSETDVDFDPEAEESIIYLYNTTKTQYEYILEFCLHYLNDPLKNIDKPLQSNNFFESVTPEWYAEFADRLDKVERYHNFLIEILKAANYLQITPLIDLLCAKLASLFLGQTVDTIEQSFNISKDNNKDLDLDLSELYQIIDIEK